MTVSYRQSAYQFGDDVYVDTDRFINENLHHPFLHLLSCPVIIAHTNAG